MKNIRIFYLKIFNFLVVKFSIYLNRHVFIMFFLFLHENILFCGYSVEVLQQGKHIKYYMYMSALSYLELRSTNI